jgi:hypothetical protein
LLGYGDKKTEKYVVLGKLEQPRQNKKTLVPAQQANETTKEGPYPFVLFESPFTSVSAVSRGHPSLAALVLYYCTL